MNARGIRALIESLNCVATHSWMSGHKQPAGMTSATMQCVDLNLQPYLHLATVLV